jgi:catechol 2,3-dioxygenase-like lactoylglutathione lyase family enzyme
MRVVSIATQLRTTNLESSIRFYTEKVGLALDFRHADFYAGIGCGGGSFHLKLIDHADPSIEFVKQREHLHLYLLVDDVDAFAANLIKNGVDLIQHAHDTAWGTREIVFQDDQGHTIYAGVRLEA